MLLWAMDLYYNKELTNDGTYIYYPTNPGYEKYKIDHDEEIRKRIERSLEAYEETIEHFVGRFNPDHPYGYLADASRYTDENIQIARKVRNRYYTQTDKQISYYKKQYLSGKISITVYLDFIFDVIDLEKYGNCGMQSQYLAIMLRRVGVDARIANIIKPDGSIADHVFVAIFYKDAPIFVFDPWLGVFGSFDTMQYFWESEGFALGLGESDMRNKYPLGKFQ